MLSKLVDQERLEKLQGWAAIAHKSADEDAYLQTQLSKQMQEMVSKIFNKQLDEALAAVEGSAYGIDLNRWRAEMREDVVVPFEDVEALLKYAPSTEDGYFVVPVQEQTAL